MPKFNSGQRVQLSTGDELQGRFGWVYVAKPGASRVVVWLDTGELWPVEPANCRRVKATAGQRAPWLPKN